MGERVLHKPVWQLRQQPPLSFEFKQPYYHKPPPVRYPARYAPLAKRAGCFSLSNGVSFSNSCAMPGTLLRIGEGLLIARFLGISAQAPGTPVAIKLPEGGILQAEISTFFAGYEISFRFPWTRATSALVARLRVGQIIAVCGFIDLKFGGVTKPRRRRIAWRPRGAAFVKGPINPNSTRGHSERWERCVLKLKAKGNPFPWAICTASTGW